MQIRRLGKEAPLFLNSLAEKNVGNKHESEMEWDTLYYRLFYVLSSFTYNFRIKWES